MRFACRVVLCMFIFGGLLNIAPWQNAQAIQLDPVYSVTLNVVVKDMTYDSTRRLAYLSASNGTILLFSFETVQLTSKVSVGADAGKMAFDPASDHLFIEADGGTAIAVVNVSTWVVEAKWTLPQASGGELALGPPGCLFASLQDDSGFQTISTVDGTSIVHQLVGYPKSQIAVSPDRRFLYVDATQMDIFKFSTDSCSPVEVLRASSPSPVDMAVSADGSKIFVGWDYGYFNGRVAALDAVQPMCPECSARQGAYLSQFSKIMKKVFSFES